MSESITIVVKKKKCESCQYSRDIYAQDGFLFIGCTHEPYRGKWVKEIKNCPLEEDNDEKGKDYNGKNRDEQVASLL